MNIRNVAISMIVCACALCGGLMLSCDDGDSGSKGPSRLVLFGTAAEYTGNLGGRAGADAKCLADVNMPADLSNVHALISVSAGDCIANMPATYGFPDNIPIIAPDRVTVIADNWADLIDGTIDVSLGDAGVLANTKGTYWWSGSLADGTLSTDNCNGWTNEDGSFSGYMGDAIWTNDDWIALNSYNSSNSNNLLGLAY